MSTGWLAYLRGYIQILKSDDTPMPARQTLKFVGASVTDDGTRTIVDTLAAGSGALLAYTEYTAGSGTHVFNSASRKRIAHIQAGGGGAGGVTTAASSVKVAAGAQAGGWQEIVETGAPTGTGVYSIGAAGTAGNGGTPTNGGDGGNTTLGMNAGTITSAGGVGSDTIAAGGAVVVNRPRTPATLGGQCGEPGVMVSSALGISGMGGSSRYGKGGNSKLGAGATGAAAGAAGSGACSEAAGASAFNGGAGVAGLIRIWEFS